MIKKNVVLPFTILREGSGALEAGSWYKQQGEHDVIWLENGGFIEDWSYDTLLRVGREIQINGPLLLEELDLLDTEASFELLHSLHSSNLNYREVIYREAVDVTGDHRSQALITLDSSRLCERIRLTSSLVLKEELSGVPGWAASKRGSILWQDEVVLDLEGSGSRFPMRDLPFSSQSRLPDGAAWHLEWRPTLLHYSFNSAVTLFLNSERKEFVERMQAGDECLVEQVMSAVIGEVCTHLLGNEEFVGEESEYPAGSLGAVAKTWLTTGLPGRKIADIKVLYEQSPSLVHTALRGLTAEV